MKRLLVLLLAAATLAAPASAATPPKQQGPGAFVTWELYMTYAGRWPKLWQRLHPAQRKHVKVLLYVACNAQIQLGFKLRKVEVTRVADVKASVPGTQIRNVPAKAVTVRVTVADATNRVLRPTQTVNVFRVKGIYYSALTKKQYDTYRAGKCLGQATG